MITNPLTMSSKITVEKEVFIKFPAVFLDAEKLCYHVKVDSGSVILEPKSGYLVPVLVILSKSKIAYHLTYENDDEKTSANIESQIATER